MRSKLPRRSDSLIGMKVSPKIPIFWLTQPSSLSPSATLCTQECLHFLLKVSSSLSTSLVPSWLEFKLQKYYVSLFIEGKEIFMVKSFTLYFLILPCSGALNPRVRKFLSELADWLSSDNDKAAIDLPSPIPGTEVELIMHSRLIFTITLWGRYYCFSQFTDEGTNDCKIHIAGAHWWFCD